MKLYFDTSIWLDFFEDRNEPNMPKGDWVAQLIKKAIQQNDEIVYSDLNVVELAVVGYSGQELDLHFSPLRPILAFVESDEKLRKRAKDLSKKRNIPQGDALHALIARKEKAALVTLDHHFKEVTDIIKPKKPNDLI